VKAALSVEPVPATREYVKVLPASGSVVESVPMAVPTALFSAMDVDESVISVGASLTSVTETVNQFSVVSPSWSVERTRME
jgi:hypothetical protein